MYQKIFDCVIYIYINKGQILVYTAHDLFIYDLYQSNIVGITDSLLRHVPNSLQSSCNHKSTMCLTRRILIDGLFNKQRIISVVSNILEALKIVNMRITFFMHKSIQTNLKIYSLVLTEFCPWNVNILKHVLMWVLHCIASHILKSRNHENLC